MVIHFLNQHRWWLVFTTAAVASAGTAAAMTKLTGAGLDEYTVPASAAAGIAIAALTIYFLCSSWLIRIWSRSVLRGKIAKCEVLLREVAEKLDEVGREAARWRGAHPLQVDLREVLEMATKQERGALQTLTLARNTDPKTLDEHIRSLGTPFFEEMKRRFRGVVAWRDYEVVVRTVAAGMDVPTDKGHGHAELEASLMRRVFSARLAKLQPEEHARVLQVWRDFASAHSDSLSSASRPALTPDEEKDFVGVGTHAMATIITGVAVLERGLTLPGSFFQGVSAMIPPMVGAKGWKIGEAITARFFQRWRIRRVLPAIVLVARMRSGLRVRRASHLQKLESEQANLRRTAEYVGGQLLELRDQESHLGALEFSVRRLRMVVPLA